jgi:hypothetical protein
VYTIIEPSASATVAEATCATRRRSAKASPALATVAAPMAYLMAKLRKTEKRRDR